MNRARSKGVGCLLIIVGQSPTLGGDARFTEEPLFRCQWGLSNPGVPASCDVTIPAGHIGADVDAISAWNVHDGANSLIVAVVGQGITPHSEFSDRLLPGQAFVGDPYDTRDTGTVGTQIAGIIAADADNQWGIAGLNDKVKLLPVRVYASDGSTTSALIAGGIDWAVSQHASVIVVLAQLPTGNESLEAAIDRAVSSDSLVVAPAGSDGESDEVFPAAFDRCLGVGATDNNDARASFSNRGAHVDLTAPGELIHATSTDGGFATASGTPLATGFVAGIAALVRSYAPNLDIDGVRQVLETSAEDLGNAGWDDEFGFGRIDAANALASSPLPPLRIEYDESGYADLTVAQPAPVTVAVIEGTESRIDDSVRLFWRTDPGDFTSLAMKAIGDDTFNASLPPLPCGAAVEYYVAAQGSAGATVTWPDQGAFNPILRVVTPTQETYFHSAESFDHWSTSEVAGSDARGAWTVGDPVGTATAAGPAQPEYDRTPNGGSLCYFTGQHFGGAASLTDVDGPGVTLASPPIDINGHDALVHFSAWVTSSGSQGHQADELRVEISYDGGPRCSALMIGPTQGWEAFQFRLSRCPDPIGSRLIVHFSIGDDPNDSLTEAAIDEFLVQGPLCATGAGDYDGDGIVGLLDHYFLIDCLSGPGAAAQAATCSLFDVDSDGDIDLQDAANHQLAFRPAP